MNWSEIQTRWGPMKAVLASYWHELSDGDLARIDGKRDVLNRVLRERYGLEPSEAEQAICTFEKEVRRPGAVK
jgi:hypothetical protein